MIFTEACRPRISDFDKNGKISYESVLQILEDVGCHNSEFVEKDILERSDEGFGWLLIDWNIHFLHQIKSAKGLTVKTWVRKEHKISSVIRDFVILSDDEIMIKAEAKYCLIDFKTGRPTKINSGILDAYEPENGCVFEESPTRLDNLNEYDYKINIQLRKSDIDLYGHLHNTRFVGLAIDNISNDEISKFNKIRIVYKNPLMIDDDVTAVYKNNGNEIYTAILKDEQPAAIIRLEWE